VRILRNVLLAGLSRRHDLLRILSGKAHLDDTALCLTLRQSERPILAFVAGRSPPVVKSQRGLFNESILVDFNIAQVHHALSDVPVEN
jgi:hypothetical protein